MLASQTTKGTTYYRVMIGRKRIMLGTDENVANTKAQALVAAHSAIQTAGGRWNDDVICGVLAALDTGLPVKLSGAWTLHELMDEWAAWMASRHDVGSQHRGRASWIVSYCKRITEDVPMSRFDRQAVVTLADTINRAEEAHTTKQSRFGYIRLMLRWIEDSGRWPEPP